MRSVAILSTALLLAPGAPLAAHAAGTTPAASSVPTAAVSPGTSSGDRTIGFRRVDAAKSGSAPKVDAVTLTTGPVAVPSDLTIIGVTWADGTGSGAKVAYRTERAGAWSAWTPADVQTCTACVEPASSPRAGSEPITLTGVSRVEARITQPGRAAAAPRLSIIDPEAPAGGETTSSPARAATARSAASVQATGATYTTGLGTDGAAATTGLAASTSGSLRAAAVGGTLSVSSASATSTPSRPNTTTRSRASWRATETDATWSLPRISPRGVVVHNTAGTNSYTRAQVPAILRGIQRFHVRDRGWSDIGYNVLVDRYGRVWEGRRGGFTTPHQGAHAAGVNGTYLGISYMGDTSPKPATTAGVNAIVDLIGWASARYGFSTTGSLWVNGLKKPAVAGHYQVGNTDCPGRDLAAKLPSIRSRAKSKAAAYRS